MFWIGNADAEAAHQPLLQAHAGPHLHWGPQAHAVCLAAGWQPQAQPTPGHAVHLQLDWVVVFMAILLSG